MNDLPTFTGNRPPSRTHEPRKAATYRAARRNATVHRRQILLRAKVKALRAWHRKMFLDHRYFHGPQEMGKIDLTGLRRVNF